MPTWDEIKAKARQAWNENPLMCIGVGAGAITAIAKLMDANTRRMNEKTWRREVTRRERNLK